MAAAAADLEARGARGRRRRAGAPTARRARRPRPGADRVPDRGRAPRHAPRGRSRRSATWALRIAAVLAIARARWLEPAAPGPARRSREAYEQNVAAVLDAAGQPGR